MKKALKICLTLSVVAVAAFAFGHFLFPADHVAHHIADNIGRIAPPALSMSLPTAFTEGLCEKIQQNMNQMFRANSPALKRTPLGTLSALVSTANTSGVEKAQVDQGNGKDRTVRVKYYQRGTEDDLTDDTTYDCSADIDKTPKEQFVTVTRHKRTKGIRFDENQMRKLCEPNSEWVANIVNSEIDPLLVSINKDLISIIGSNFGKFNPDISPDTYKEVPLLKSDGSANYNGEASIMQDFNNIDSGNARPILIGNGKLDTYTRVQKLGCCNLAGIDMSQAGQFDYYYDRFVAGQLGNADQFIGLVPGYVQFLTWNKYKGEYANDGNIVAQTLYQKGIIVDPLTGISLDMKATYDYCNEFWVIKFGLHYDLYFLPDDAFADNDELNGVNFTLNYRATQLS